MPPFSFFYGQTKKTINKFMSNWVNTKDENGMTALHYAMKNGYIDIVETLLDFEADPTIGIKGNNRNVLHIATQCKSNNKKLIEIIFDKLEQQGIDKLDMVNSQDSSGFTPLFLAISFHIPLDSIQLLLENKANPNIQENKQGQTAFHLACDNFMKLQQKNVKILEKFQTNSSEMSSLDQNKYDQYLQDLESAKSVILLLSNFSDVNLGDHDNWTALAKACKVGNFELAQLLIENCVCKVDVKLKSGETPLILASQIRKNEDLCRKICQLLIKNGANEKIAYSKHNILAEHWLKRNKYGFSFEDLKS